MLVTPRLRSCLWYLQTGTQGAAELRTVSGLETPTMHLCFLQITLSWTSACMNGDKWAPPSLRSWSSPSLVVCCYPKQGSLNICVLFMSNCNAGAVSNYFDLVVAKRMILQLYVSFICRLEGLRFIYVKRSSDIWRELRELLFLHVKRSQWRGLGNWLRFRGCIPPQFLLAHQTGKKPRTQWKNSKFHLAWEDLRIPQDDLESVSRERDFWKQPAYPADISNQSQKSQT